MSVSLETVTIQIENFIPYVHTRYRARTETVYKKADSWFGKKVTIYEIAWVPSIGFSYPIDDPINFRVGKCLSPTVYITGDKQLIVTHYSRFIHTDIASLDHRQLHALLLGLRGDFARIDAEYDTYCRKETAEHIDRIIKRTRDKKAEENPTLLRRQTLELLVDMESDSREYLDAKQQLVTQLLA